MKPHITTPPPGPRAQAILERDERVVAQSMVREYPLVLQKASGVNLWDVDQNRYLDFSAGIAVMNVGWNHPRVVRAVQEQVESLSHGAFLDFASEMPIRFAEQLVGFLPEGLDRVYFSNSGAESVEAAMKLARHHTRRKYFISFYGGFHGRTYGAVSLTCSKVIQREYFGPFISVIHAPYANPYRPLGFDQATCDVDAVRYIEEEIFRAEVSPYEVAAIVVEPIQGEGGYIVPPPHFLRRIRDICDTYGILLVMDEVQAGCFRTGTFLASEQFGIVPDIVCLAKAIGGGLPLGVTIAGDEVMTWPPGSHASTFGGNNASCAAGCAVLDIMGTPGFGSHVEDMGNRLLKGLHSLQQQHPLIGDVRGRGLMCGCELVVNRVTKEPAREALGAILRKAFASGLVLLPAGESVIRFCPPLIIEKEDVDVGLGILDQCLTEVEEGLPG
jgi:4-aminobutyrate aminotransferase